MSVHNERSGSIEGKDSLDLICEQIVRVVRHEGENKAANGYYAMLRDGQWIYIGGMNDILKRFIFDNRHCKRTSTSSETEYYRQ